MPVHTPAPDPAAAPPPAAPARPPRRQRRLLRRSALALLASLLLVGAGICAIVAWLIATTTGMNTALSLANRFAPVKIEARGGFGTLARDFGFAELIVTAGNTTVAITELRASLRRFRLEPLQFDFNRLQARSLRIDVTPGADPSPPVQDIGVPLEVSADRLTVDELALRVGATSLAARAIDTRAAIGPWGYRVTDGRLAVGAHTATLAGELGARRPFALQADAALAAQVREQSLEAKLRARGSLVDFALDGEVSGAGASGTMAARIASFDPPAVRSLAVDLAGVDPHLWHPAAPSADLTVKAQLVPDDAMQRVAGDVQVVNRAAGTLDAGRIPVRSATARIEADRQQLQIERIVAQLTQGRASGEFRVAFADGQWQTRAQLADVDLSGLHGRLRPLRIDGDVRARHRDGTHFVTADLAHRGRPAATLALDAEVTPQVATVRTARLALGDGFAAASGTVELTGQQRIDIKGELQGFEPGRLIADVDARVNGQFAAGGELQPQPNGSVRFELADSRAWGRPLTGRGRVDLDAGQRLDVDVDLAVRSARLSARGGLGAPDRALAVTLEVPALEEVVPGNGTPVRGALKLAATARGAWTAPRIVANVEADGLRYGEHMLEALLADLAYGGGADGTLRVHAGLARYRYLPQPAATLRAVTLAVDGRISSHGILFKGTTEKSHSATLFAQGGWRDAAWRGFVREAAVGPPFDARLLAPADLVVGAKTAFGPAQLALQHVRVDGLVVTADADALATRGTFSGLQPMLLVPPAEGVLGPVLAPTGERPPLALRGQWDLRLGRQADGRVLVERSGGDIYAGRGAESALQLIDARLEATITANQIAAILRVESERRGGVGAHLDAWLENSAEAGWRLAQRRPWLISGAFDLPSMDWVNAVLSERIRANVRLGGKMAGTVRIEGTPGDPSASGRLSGEELRFAWVEQGMRLENGRLHARLQDDLIVLEDLQFTGPPRVRPADRRAAAAAGDRDGSVSASGQLRLRDFSGVIQFAADRLPLLQRSDRWVIASGGGNIETSAKHVQLNAAAAAVAGYVDFSRSELPSPSSDVVIVRAQDAAAERARRVTFGFDLGIDLGPAFYLRGNGLDTRVDGVVRLRSAGRGVVSAVGSIEAIDGTYEGFGQKLKIARGRVNFQGAPENPGLDILALRTGLPVEVGVTITRTAIDPLVRLHSDPPMADVEALSWLVLGRAADQTRGDTVALFQAAASLLGGGGEGYPTRVVRALGFDELTIRSGHVGAASLLPARGVAGALRSDEASTATVAGEIITVGKRLGEALTLSYEQAISGTSRIVQLNYQLSSRLSLVARAGTDNAVDLVYTLAFD